MSTLQISLGVAGGLVLAALVAHNAWTARKNLPKQASPRESAPEPSPTDGDAVPQEGDAMSERQEPSFDVDSGLTALGQLTALEKKPGLDVLIDAMASVTLESVVSGEAALAAMPGTRRVGSKPFGVEGLSAITGEWEFPTAGHRYSAFQCGVQLANRTGALNQIE